MGMAASQARYLNLIAQQNDLEFQGQQINESRSTLSDQVNNLYTQLQNMNVPTPPVTNDYTNIVYTTTDGASKYTLGNITPSIKEKGKYNVDMKYSAVGSSLAPNLVQSTVAIASDKINLTAVETAETSEKTIEVDSLTGYYLVDSNGTVKKATVTKDENTGKYSVTIPEGSSLYKKDPSGTEYDNPDKGKVEIGGSTALKYDEARLTYGDAIAWNDYSDAITHSFGKGANPEDFYWVINKKGEGIYDVTLYPIEDVSTNGEPGITAKGYKYETGTYETSANYDYVELEFDSTGRISKILLPTEYNEEGVATAWKELDVAAKSQTDNAAFEKAMNEYEHAKLVYDREQTEINAQMEIIQGQDKKLELKLTRLDNERRQITSEIEALKKVIQENIEKSFKTFSG